MSMTKEEAIKEQESLLAYWESGEAMVTKRAVDALRWSIEALYALRPITREQVEKVWRGEWEGTPRLGVYYMTCSKCGFCPGMIFYSSDFCPNCGAPMTDKAVDMVMERLEDMT